MERRHLFKSFVTGLGFLWVFKIQARLASSCPQAPPSNERIRRRFITEAHKKRVGFVAHWEEARGHEKFTEGANCANCAFYRPDRKEPTFGRCIRTAMLFVPSCAWCDQYGPLPSEKT